LYIAWGDGSAYGWIPISGTWAQKESQGILFSDDSDDLEGPYSGMINYIGDHYITNNPTLPVTFDTPDEYSLDYVGSYAYFFGDKHGDTQPNYYTSGNTAALWTNTITRISLERSDGGETLNILSGWNGGNACIHAWEYGSSCDGWGEWENKFTTPAHSESTVVFYRLAFCAQGYLTPTTEYCVHSPYVFWFKCFDGGACP